MELVMNKILLIALGVLAFSTNAYTHESYNLCFVMTDGTQFKNASTDINPRFVLRMNIMGRKQKHDAEIIFSKLITFTRNRPDVAIIHQHLKSEISEALEDFERDGTCKKIKN